MDISLSLFRSKVKIFLVLKKTISLLSKIEIAPAYFLLSIYDKNQRINQTLTWAHFGVLYNMLGNLHDFIRNNGSK
jgi:hypothetical protein